MRNKRITIASITILAISVSMSLATATAAMAQESLIYSFNFTDGNAPEAGPILDSAGNLYGTIPGGGSNGLGLVYELMATSGGWTEVVLHDFSKSDGDGQDPSAGLVFDAAGNLYGTTPSGGAYGFGTVFELSPLNGGGWAESVLYSFGSGSDGQTPLAGLVLDQKGNLYGTTSAGGTYAGGTVFELSPQTGGGWAEIIIHSFDNDGTDGYYPQAAVTLNSAGDLFGTASRGGAYSGGIVFELSPNAEGGWSEYLLHTFHDGASDGGDPSGALLLSAAGNNLYGTAGGGLYAEGIVFELSREANGVWVEKLLYTFLRNTDGRNPSGLVFDASGRLYGTTSVGGGSGFGTVYELAPTAGGGWKERVLHSFNLFDGDGAYPVGPLVIDGSGNLYGGADQGGVYEDGAVFAITP
jgi:uncharacterized repeat protein (TIGR03803 family)